MNVYTFHRKLNGVVTDDSRDLLPYWRESWYKNGWNPIVIEDTEETLGILQSHPLSEAFFNHPAFRQTINPWQYEVACFLRWLYMAQVPMGFFAMSDYDVMNFGFSPDHVLGNLSQLEYDPVVSNHVTLYDEHCPCVVSGTRYQFDLAAAFFANCALMNKSSAQGSVSDQNWIRNHWPHRPFGPRLVRENGEEGCETSPLVHFCNEHTPKPRANAVHKVFSRRANW